MHVDRRQHPPFLHPIPFFSSFFISVDWCNQKTASPCTYQSIYAIRKRHIIAVLHISKPWKWKKKKKKWKRGAGCKKGDAVSCPQAPVIRLCIKFNLYILLAPTQEYGCPCSNQSGHILLIRSNKIKSNQISFI